MSDHLELGTATLYRKIIGKRRLPGPASAVSPISAGPVPPCITTALHPRLHQPHAGRVRSDADHAKVLEMRPEGSASRAVIAAIRLLMLTGRRSGEILSFRWEDVDLDRGELRLPDSKTVHLGEPAIAVIRGRNKLPGYSESPMDGQPLLPPSWGARAAPKRKRYRTKS